MKLQASDTIGESGVIGHDQAAFRAGDVFDGVEREYCRAAMPDRSVVISRAHRVSRIFNNGNAMLLSQLINRCDIGGRTGVMHRNNGAGAWRNSLSYSFRRHHQVVRIHINHDGRGTQQRNQVKG